MKFWRENEKKEEELLRTAYHTLSRGVHCLELMQSCLRIFNLIEHAKEVVLSVILDMFIVVWLLRHTLLLPDQIKIQLQWIVLFLATIHGSSNFIIFTRMLHLSSSFSNIRK